MASPKLNILFLTDNFPPERNVPAMRTWEHVSRWVKDGHKVTIITTAPNFPQGKPLAGYTNRWYMKEDMGGVTVIRVKSYIAANEGFLKRILEKDQRLKVICGILTSVAAIFSPASPLP